jgi:hypothetical protein
VSFDVEALFPSVPKDEALKCIASWVDEQDVSDNEAEKFLELARICMHQCVFKWGGKFYKQTSGLSIGNGFSPFAADVFMCNLEMKASKESWFPKFWARYVDDVIAVVKNSEVENVVKELNTRSPTIKFTCEREKERKIPFLDIMLSVNGEKISFDIYRKPQHVQRYIPSHSNHPMIHKMAAFDTMIHRLCNTPLTTEKFNREFAYITETAAINGYGKGEIENLLKKHKHKAKIKTMTTLIPDRSDRIKKTKTYNGRERTIFVELPFFPPATDRIQKILKNHNINSYYTSKGNLKDIIGSLKDVIPTNEKSGIYEVSCATCDDKYRGQTCRRCIDRYSEHERAFRLKQPTKSAIAKHCLEEGHQIGDFKLLKNVTDKRKLDAWESLLIERGNSLVNIDDPLISSPLFKI